jgi:hypothetical protein
MALPTTRAYVSDADADDYFVHTFRGNEWIPLTVTEKTLALQEATRALETLCYKGEKCSDTQPLKWPRKLDEAGCCAAADCTALPSQMVEATCELALSLHKNPTAIFGGGISGAGAQGAIKSNKLGDLQQDFYDVKDGQASSSRYGPESPKVLQAFPWLSDLLGCWADVGGRGARILSRCC